MKRLIVNADDLAADDARNAGIFEAIEAGVVTSASILVNGPAFENCLQRIASANLDHVSFGIHLNLTEGVPLSPGLKSLTGPGGYFCGKAEGHRRLMRKGDKAVEEEVRREFTAQIAALCDAGIQIDHVDGHQHVHIFPAAIDSIIGAATEFGILWIRIPEEPRPSKFEDRSDRMLRKEAAMFSELATAACMRIQGSPLRRTDHFRGLYLKGMPSVSRLERILRTLPPGLTELMVHPGRIPDGQAEGPFSAFSHAERERELEILMSRRFHRMLKKYGVQLASFGGVCP